MGAERTIASLLADANINPVTGLATDYLNHFNEAIMLLEMVASCPECRDDLRAWQPRGYREHFRHARFKARDLAIAAYDAAEPASRDTLEALAGTMTVVIEHSRAALSTERDPYAAGIVADRAAAWLKLLVAQAGAVINGQRRPAQSDAAQAAADKILRRLALQHRA